MGAIKCKSIYTALNNNPFGQPKYFTTDNIKRNKKKKQLKTKIIIQNSKSNKILQRKIK